MSLPPPAAKVGHWSTRVGSDWFLAILLGATLLVRLAYLYSYPFLIEGDGVNYYTLLLESHSSLVHATGYVFLSLPFRWLANLAGIEPASLLLYSQQAISAASVVALYLALRRVVPRWLSFLTCLPLGVDAQLVTAAGTTRPEFFQADILMLTIGSAIFGFTSLRKRNKTLFYCACGFLAAAGFLTKYNFLPSLVFCLLPLFDARLSWRARAGMVAKSAAAGTLLFAGFLTGFHYPTTQTFRLNCEHGWIHLIKLEKAAIPLLPANGVATQKYIVLSESLPPVRESYDPWKSMNAVPETVRAPVRQAWSKLLESNDPEFVRAAFDALAPAPRRPSYHAPSALYPIYFYLGLNEGEKLLGDVFREALAAHPRLYLSNVWETFAHSAGFSAHYEPYLPVPGAFEPAGFFEGSTTPFFAPRARVVKGVDWSVATPKDLAELAAHVWYPGARFLSWFAFLKHIPASSVWAVMLAGFAAVVHRLGRRRRLGPVGILFILAAVSLLGEMGFAAVVFVFRNKDLILCQPLLSLMIGLSVWLCVEFVSTWRKPA